MGPINWPWLIAGLVIGTNIGLLLLGLCLAAKNADRHDP